MDERPYDEKDAYQTDDLLDTRPMRLPPFDGGATAEMPKIAEGPLKPPPFDENKSFTISGDGVWQDGYNYPLNDTEMIDLVRHQSEPMRTMEIVKGVPLTGLPTYEKFHKDIPQEEINELRRQGDELIRRNRLQIAPNPTLIQEIVKGNQRGWPNMGGYPDHKYEDEVLPGDNHANYQEKAKAAVKTVVDDDSDLINNPRPMYEVYIVWFCKTLKNWKACLGTTLADKRYYEVTYNGESGETYVDVYEKIHQEVFYEPVLTSATNAKVLALMESGGLSYEMSRHLIDTLKSHGILFHEKIN